MISDDLKGVELARRRREGALLRDAEVVVDAHVVVDAGFLLAGCAAETGRRRLCFWWHFVENGLEEVRRVFFDEGVSAWRVQRGVSDFVQTLHLLKVSAGDRNGFVLLCK